MEKYIKGLDLCEAFFNEFTLPIIKQHYPDLKFSAGVITAGSQILGYDDIVSTDHDWSPGCILFLAESDLYLKDELTDLFNRTLPTSYGWFESEVAIQIWISTIDEVIEGYIGKIPENDLDWLTISEHRLLGLTAGRIFIDMLNIEETRRKLSFYPQDVKLYLIASQWSIISEEQAFVKRTSDVGDEIGSRIICARIAERLMRLCFLYKNKYAPIQQMVRHGF